MAEEKENLSLKARQGILWTILRTLSSQAVRFIASIFLARLLFPEDFGILGIVLIVTRFATRLGSFGFTQVLIQKKIINDVHIRTTFTVNLLIAASTTLILYFMAPYISPFLLNGDDLGKLPLVIDVLRLLSINFILIALYSVPNSLLKRKLKFKQESLIGIIAGIAKFLSPVIYALFGFGVWSLVLGPVTGEVMYVIAFYMSTRWVPRLGMNKQALKHIFSFGVWMNLYSYIQYAYKNIDYYFISRFLGLTQLGFYERAYNLMNTPRKRVGDMINSVLLATYARIQDDDERMNNALRTVMSTVALITFPLMTTLYFIAPALIKLLYGEKWLGVVAPLQIMTISGLIESVTMVFYPAFIARGLVKHRTRVHFVVTVVLGITLFFTARISIEMVAWTIVLVSALGFVLNSTEYMRNTSWRWRDTFKSIFPAAVLTGLIIPGCLMAGRLAAQWFSNDSIYMLMVYSITAAFVFFGSNFIFKFSEIKNILAFVRGKNIVKA